jgi:hypothetical protein
LVADSTKAWLDAPSGSKSAKFADITLRHVHEEKTTEAGIGYGNLRPQHGSSEWV